MSHGSPEVTVLVPIYNAEQYLSTCLDSLLSQTKESIEIVCINDGSTDNSMEIIEKSARKDPRITVFDKTNSGYGDSLNQGLERANGDYIGIIESDDFANATMFENLFAIATRNGAEIVKSDFFEHANGVSRKADIIPKADANKLIAPTDDFAIFKSQPSIWSAIYARTFLDSREIVFTDSPGAAFQDTVFNLKTLATSDKVWLTDDAYVHYRRDNDGSSIHSNDKVFAVCDEYENFERYMENYPDRMAKIERKLQAVKFETFSWNLSRLSGQAREKFFTYMHQRFVSLQKDGLICYEDFATEDAHLLALLLGGDSRFVQASIEARNAKFATNTP